MRVCIFFDGKNFHSGWRDEAGGRRLAFPKLSRWLVDRVGGSLLWGAYYYTGVEIGSAAVTEGQKKLAGFLDMLEVQPGFFVKRFPRKTTMFQCAACGAENRYTQEKEVDTSMVADMLRLAAVNAFDVLVLVSGDSDHAPAVEGVRQLGRQAYVSTWGRAGLSIRLRKAAFDHIDLLEGISFFEDNEGSGAPAPPGPEPRWASEEIPPAVPTPPAGSVPREAIHEECEDAEEADPDASESAPPSYQPSDDESVFIEELRAAERRLRNGYVGANYFVTRWQSNRLDPSPDARRRMLEHLVTSRVIEVYHAPDGNAAIRARDE
ncbi:NYN domain-containing protein [Polyangium mundeleinium]|uniref:NYN domain-containing protein n=1 Tax=Polyangium mundeleinium TaxID=2995306 RepID=A0ABT5EEI7_9BACT|nr:NYN domain-containing protein [Polyangium mundeleinium]MDC0740225.1 NYN domain-containing protein [Polyangium mundeleinium]